jgi:hypothetical protein
MKLFNAVIVIIAVLCGTSIFATSLNGRFVVVKSDTSKLSVLLQVNTNTGSDDMGGATIVIQFDKNVLSYSSDPVANVNYKFFNFSGGNYNEATVTKPLSDKLWINIDLPADNNNKGTVISGSNGWTDVVQLNFDVKSPRDTARVKWLESNIFWQIYDANNSTNFSVGSFSDLVSAPVTVELLSFTAVLMDNSNIKLDWSTITYADNAGYEIEKSLTPTPSLEEGALGSVSWEKIGFVASKNIFNTPVNYSFTDNIAGITSNLKYRLKSVNNDATFSIMSEIEVVVVPDKFTLDQNYPNPFNPSTKIRYTIPASVNSSDGGKLVQLKVYDILGNEVATLVNELQHPGQHEVVFDAAGLASGVYIYRLETTGFVDTKKMILLR